MSHAKRSRNLLALLAVFVLVAAACSSSTSDNGIRDFTEIQTSDFEFTVDENGVVRMETTTGVEAVCSIAWGESDDLGFLNTDLDMQGGGHNNHEVILVGAEPGKTYSFRVQGATSDGSMFQSPISTFTVPDLPEGSDNSGTDDAVQDGDVTADDAMAVHGTNLAEGAAVRDVSSEFSASWAGANAVDGDMSTEWATAGSGDDAFIEIDLGSVQQVVGVEFITRTMSDGTATTTEYTVTVDGGESFGPFAAGNPSDARFAEAVFEGQILRFEVVASTGGNTGAIEVRAFAPPTS